MALSKSYTEKNIQYLIPFALFLPNDFGLKQFNDKICRVFKEVLGNYNKQRALKTSRPLFTTAASYKVMSLQ